MRFIPAKSDVEVVDVGSISVRVMQPSSAIARPMAALLWIHGGGYVIGNAAQDDQICRHFVAELGIVVASLDYRLAPEYKFPAALDDCYEALSWLSRHKGVDATRIAIGGASAGGGLAAALALMVRERGEIGVAFQLLAYPMLDDRTATRTDIDESNFRLWNNRSNRFGWQSYLGQTPGSANISHLAAPSRSNNLSGLPPAWIGVGTCDLFCDEDVAYADRLRAAGVECALDVVPGAFHGFDLVKKAGVTTTFRTNQVTALRSALRPPPD
jgi:acetyl esterase/lipase